MRRSVLVLCVLVAACGGKTGSSSKEVRVAAASDLARALEEVGPAFEKQSGIKVTVTAGSTGLLAKQLEERAPFDLFLSANKKFADDVVAAGACDGSTQALYARGRLVVWSRGDGVPKTLEELADPKYKKIGIGNPDHAPYGTAAKQALIKAGVWDKIKDRVVYGENIQVTMQWAKAGEVDAALVALSLAVVADGGSSTPVDTALHEPLDQAMVVCGSGPGAEAAKKLQAYLGSDEGREIMTRYGFLLPGETGPEPKGGTGGDRVAAAAKPPIPVPAVTKLLDVWARAQNEDDFDDYQRYYAERFTGIKRAGPRTWKFDRNGWFADRARMFKAKAAMTVTIEQTKVVSVGQMAIVTFTQTFQQGKFKDTGPKQLIVIDQNGVLKIAREEMLTSTMVGGPGANADAIAYSIVDNTEGTWLLVDQAYDVETKGDPKDAGGSTGFSYSAITELAMASPLVGQTVTVYPGGATCKIDRAVVLSMFTPHFGTEMMWDGDEDGDGEAESAPLDDAAIAESVASAGSSYLAAEIGDCGGAGVVGVIGKSGTEWAKAADSTLADAAEALFLTLPEHKAIQDEFTGEYDGQGAWHDHESGGLTGDSWIAPGGDAVTVVGATAGIGCGQFYGSLYAVFTSKAGGPPVFHSLISGSPSVAVDLDGDGVAELASDDTIWAVDGDTYSDVSTVDYGFGDCGC